MKLCYTFKVIIEYGSVAQWLERRIHKPQVVGSNLTRVIYLLSRLLNIYLGEMAEWSKAIDC